MPARRPLEHLMTQIAMAVLLTGLLFAFVMQAKPAQAGTLVMTACSGFGDSGNATDVGGAVWQGVDSSNLSTSNHCPQGGSFQILPSGYPRSHENVQWNTTTPASIQIIHALTPVNEVLIDPNISGDGYSASFFWEGGTQTIVPENNCCGGMDYGSGINRPLGSSRWFGWQVTCTSGPCTQPLQLLDVRGVELQAVDNTPPGVLALGSDNIWYQTARWVRGSWPASWAASADDGICGMQAIVDGQSIPGPSDPSPNQHSWTQCPTPVTMNMNVNTTQYANGAMPLVLSAADAASPANVSSPSETLHVDNQPVSLTLSGPVDALSTSGTQYVDASATAGPSGIAGISCSIDGAPHQWYATSSARIAVQGLGEHQIVCDAQNNSIDSSGNPAHSPTAGWTLSIRQPSVSTVSFARVADALRCSARHERVRIPAHWVTAFYKGHPVRIELPAQTRRVKVVHCHARIVRRRVRVHGHWRAVNAVVLPHSVALSSIRVRRGAGAAVSGWLGTTNGNALAGQSVQVLTAPDNGSQQFTQVAAATTGADGSWTAHLPPGPSRLVVAQYGGTGTVEPATSTAARVVVPASVSLRIRPHHAHWGGRITIGGRLKGGYIPPAGELVVLWVGWPGGSTEIGHLYARSDGKFSGRYTFLRGNGTETYRLWAATARESDYPYAPASSRRVSVTVGP
jgi:hypothetical protein